MRLHCLLAATLLGAAPLTAQEGVPITHKDVERLNPAAVILDRRDQLRLEKAQVAKLDSLRKAFDDSAKHMADDVRKAQRAITTPPPLIRRPPDGKPETRKDSANFAKIEAANREKRDKYFETVTTGRRDLAGVLLSLKDLFDVTLDSTIKTLDGTQHTTSALMLERTAAEFTRRLRLANIR